MDNGKMNYFGGDLAVSMAGAKSMEDALKERAVESYNEEYQKTEDQIKANIERELKAGREVTEKMNSMEIVPLNNYVLVRPYAKIK